MNTRRRIDASNLTFAEALAGIKATHTIENVEPFEIDMAMRGFEPAQYREYLKIKPNEEFYTALQGLTSAIKNTPSDDILGVRISPNIKLFEQSNYGCLAEMLEILNDIRAEVFDGYEQPAVGVENLTESQIFELVERENMLVMAYYDNLPKMLSLAIAGMKNELPETDYTEQILNGPAVPAIAFAQSFFLKLWMPKILEVFPLFFLYSTVLQIASAQNSIGESIPRILTQMLHRNF
jgi:hypothetical protein